MRSTLTSLSGTLNHWGASHWGLILVLFAISYFLSNVIRNTWRLVWAFRAWQFRRQTLGTWSSNRRAMRSIRQATPEEFAERIHNRPSLAEVLDRSTDLELANSLSRERLERLNGLAGHLRSH